jgi:hypothetical protein
MDWRVNQYEICSGIEAELSKSAEYLEYVVSARIQEGDLWKVFVDLSQDIKSGLDETLEGAAAWWGGPPKGAADVLSVSPETEQINLRFATSPPPDRGGRIRICHRPCAWRRIFVRDIPSGLLRGRRFHSEDGYLIGSR